MNSIKPTHSSSVCFGLDFVTKNYTNWIKLNRLFLIDLDLFPSKDQNKLSKTPIADPNKKSHGKIFNHTPLVDTIYHILNGLVMRWVFT